MSELKTSIDINFGMLCCERHVKQVVRLQFIGIEIAEGGLGAVVRLRVSLKPKSR